MMNEPLLAPNKPPDPIKMRWPVLVSKKLDGIRCIIYDGKLYSRTGKELPNKNLQNHLKPVLEASVDSSIVFDGELYQHGLAFNSHTSILMSDSKPLPDNLKFHCFDLLTKEQWDDDTVSQPNFADRYDLLLTLPELLNFNVLQQTRLHDWEEVKALYDTFLQEGYEGAILRYYNGKYKHGRATEKEGIIFKLKPSKTVDVTVVGYYQKKKMKDDIARTLDAFGGKEVSHKKDDYELEEALGGLVVELDNKIKVEVGTGFDLQGGDKDRTLLWQKKDTLLGKKCAIKYMPLGIKESTGVPRHPVFVDWRPDLD